MKQKNPQSNCWIAGSPTLYKKCKQFYIGAVCLFQGINDFLQMLSGKYALKKKKNYYIGRHSRFLKIFIFVCLSLLCDCGNKSVLKRQSITQYQKQIISFNNAYSYQFIGMKTIPVAT